MTEEKDAAPDSDRRTSIELPFTPEDVIRKARQPAAFVCRDMSPHKCSFQPAAPEPSADHVRLCTRKEHDRWQAAEAQLAAVREAIRGLRALALEFCRNPQVHSTYMECADRITGALGSKPDPELAEELDGCGQWACPSCGLLCSHDACSRCGQARPGF